MKQKPARQPYVKSMRSQADFAAVWREMETSLGNAAALSDMGIERLYRAWEPQIELVEHADAYTLRADLPGMAPDDLDVVYRDGVLTIHGKFMVDGEQAQRQAGAFTRRFALAKPVDADALRISYQADALDVHLPKTAATPVTDVPTEHMLNA